MGAAELQASAVRESPHVLTLPSPPSGDKSCLPPPTPKRTMPQAGPAHERQTPKMQHDAREVSKMPRPRFKVTAVALLFANRGANAVTISARNGWRVRGRLASPRRVIARTADFDQELALVTAGRAGALCQLASRSISAWFALVVLAACTSARSTGGLATPLSTLDADTSQEAADDCPDLATQPANQSQNENADSAIAPDAPDADAAVNVWDVQSGFGDCPQGQVCTTLPANCPELALCCGNVVFGGCLCNGHVLCFAYEDGLCDMCHVGKNVDAGLPETATTPVETKSDDADANSVGELLADSPAKIDAPAAEDGFAADKIVLPTDTSQTSDAILAETFTDAAAKDETANADAAPSCMAKACDDGNPCTVDECGLGDACTHTAIADGMPCGASPTDACTTGWQCQSANCAPIGKVFEKTLGVGVATGLTATTDDGLAAVGYTDSDGSYPWDIPLLVRADGQGVVKWSKTYPKLPGAAWAIARLPDGFVFGGGGDMYQAFMAKVDANGAEVWTSVLPVGDTVGTIVWTGQSYTILLSQQLSQSSLVMVGQVSEVGKLTAAKSLVDGCLGALSLAAAPSGSIFAANVAGPGCIDDKSVPWLVRLGGNGEQLWKKTYPDVDVYFDTVIAVTDGYFVVGRTWSQSQWHVRLLHMDLAGQLLWNHLVADGILPLGAIQALDGGIAVFGKQDKNRVLFRSDADGNVQWMAEFVGDSKFFEDLIVTPTGFALVGGFNDKVLWTQTDHFGHSSCTDAGVCLGIKAIACDDGQSCTADGCDGKLGCTHTDAKWPCDDGDPCTVEESCSAGKCQGGKAVKCP